MLKYVLTLRFDQVPDYDYIINQIVNVMKDDSPTHKHVFEWTVKQFFMII